MLSQKRIRRIRRTDVCEKVAGSGKLAGNCGCITSDGVRLSATLITGQICCKLLKLAGTELCTKLAFGLADAFTEINIHSTVV